MSGRVFNISLALEWNERFDHRIAVGIIKYSRRRGEFRLFGNDWLFQTEHSDLPRPDGIIARITSREDLERLQSFGVPVIDIADAGETGLPRAVNDDFFTGRMGAGHLLERGYPRLAFVGVEGAEWSRNRFRGLCEVLRERVLSESPACFDMVPPLVRRGFDLSDLAGWLGGLSFPCGVMAANDLIGYRVTLAAEMAGLRVPDDLGVIGVDNEDVYCQLSQPALTSINCDCEGIGGEAADLLWRILNGEDPLRQVVVAPLEILERGSTKLLLSEDVIIGDVRRFIEANIGRGINVSDVASFVPLSRRALEKRFKGRTGRTLHEEIMEVRLGRAREILLSGGGVSEAGYESGFRTIPHFYHVFRGRYGMTPLEYARRHK